MKKFWVKAYSTYGYNFFSRKKDVPNYYNPDIFLFRKEFDKLTGLKLKPGEIVQCELKVIKKEK